MWKGKINMSFLDNMESCGNCFKPKWCHDGEGGKCLGFNGGGFDDKGVFVPDRQGCDFNCPGWEPIPELENKLNTLFWLTPRENYKASSWIKKHECSRRGQYMGAIGGSISYEFTGTSIGMLCSVKCICGKSQFVTEDDGF